MSQGSLPEDQPERSRTPYRSFLLQRSQAVNPTDNDGVSRHDQYVCPPSPKQTIPRSRLEQSCSVLSEEEVALALKGILPSDDKDGHVSDLTDTSFDDIASLLRQAGRENWSLRPRTYAVLKMVNLVELIDNFVQEEFFDIALPYAFNSLPKSLSPAQRHRILGKQELVLTKAARIEGGPGSAHANFGDSARSEFLHFQR